MLVAFLLTFSLATQALTWTDPETGIIWNYTKLSNGTASIGTGKEQYPFGKTVSGDLVVPDTINGLKVSQMKAYAFYNCRDITSITFKSNISVPANAKCIFYGCWVLKSVNFEKINVSNATNMESMFRSCKALNNLEGLENWNVGKVTNMKNMFHGCQNLTDISALSNWNVSKVTNMYYMFNDCNALADLTPLSNWNVSNLTNMSYMFGYCYALVTLNGLENWNVSKVTTLDNTFNYCRNLEDISALHNWDVSNVTIMSSTFCWCHPLSDLSPIANWDVSNVTDMTSMFHSVTSLTDLSPLQNWNTGNVTDMGGMFAGNYLIDDSGLENLINWNTSNVTKMTRMFTGCNSLVNLSPLKNWDFSNVQDVSYMFEGCKGLTNIDISQWNLGELTNEKYTDTGGIYANQTYSGKSLMFYNCINLKRIKLPLSTLQRLNSGIFQGCEVLEEITLPSNTIKISPYAFNKCGNLQSITLPSNMENITYRAFYQCNSLNAVYCMATTPPTLNAAAFDSEDGTTTGTINKTLYVKTSALEAYRNHEQWGRFAVITDQIPFTIAAGKQYSTLAVDFDADFSETEGIAPYVAAKYYEGRTAAAKVATAYQRAGMPAKAKAAAEDNTIRTIVLAQFTDKYIPSRTGDDNFTFHGALIYGKPGTYYYKMGERDYASGSQVTEDWENNYMMPAYETWQLSPTYTQEPENWMYYPKEDTYNFVLKDGRFKYIDNQGSIPRHKAWLSLPAEIVSGTYQEAGAKMAITFEDGDTGDTETTGITFITEQKDRDGNVTYNLAGQQVDDTYKGVVIRNGKTFIKK